MKGILSYRFTGEDPKELEPLLKTIHTGLLELGFDEVFCSIFFESFFNENNYLPDQRYDYCIKQQEDKDVFVAFLRSHLPSTGVTKEFKEAQKLRQKIILIIKEGMEQFHPEIVHAAGISIIRFKTEDDLTQILSANNPATVGIFTA